MTIDLVAYAKINLGLRILARRVDGYHDIETVFRRIDWTDDLTIRSSESGIMLRTDDPTLPTDERNLCVRAVHVFRAHTGWDGGVVIDLHKRIPAGAGLGGGSADAAAVLTALARIAGTDPDIRVLHPMARELGADVPFFLGGETAHATGIGEILTPVTLHIPDSILVVTPPISISTAWAYSALQGPFPRTTISLLEVLHSWQGQFDPSQATTLLPNDFEEVVFAREPILRAMKGDLLHFGARWASMSGSGSSLFGFFSSDEQARLAVEQIEMRFPESRLRHHLTSARDRDCEIFA